MNDILDDCFLPVRRRTKRIWWWAVVGEVLLMAWNSYGAWINEGSPFVMNMIGIILCGAAAVYFLKPR